MSHRAFSSLTSRKPLASLFVLVMSVTETIILNSPSVCFCVSGQCLAEPRDVMIIHHASRRAVNNWSMGILYDEAVYIWKVRLHCAVEQSASFISAELSISFKVKHWQGVHLHNLTHNIEKSSLEGRKKKKKRCLEFTPCRGLWEGPVTLGHIRRN